jgi:hypothetical protein
MKTLLNPIYLGVIDSIKNLKDIFALDILEWIPMSAYAVVDRFLGKDAIKKEIVDGQWRGVAVEASWCGRNPQIG